MVVLLLKTPGPRGQRLEIACLSLVFHRFSIMKRVAEHADPRCLDRRLFPLDEVDFGARLEVDPALGPAAGGGREGLAVGGGARGEGVVAVFGGEHGGDCALVSIQLPFDRISHLFFIILLLSRPKTLNRVLFFDEFLPKLLVVSLREKSWIFLDFSVQLVRSLLFYILLLSHCRPLLLLSIVPKPFEPSAIRNHDRQLIKRHLFQPLLHPQKLRLYRREHSRFPFLSKSLLRFSFLPFLGF